MAGNSGTKEWHGLEFSAFSFCLKYPWLGVEETGSLKMPTDACSLYQTE